MNVRDNEEGTACTNTLKTLYLNFCLFREANEAHRYTKWSEKWGDGGNVKTADV